RRSLGADSGKTCHLTGDLGHLGTRLQVALTGAAIYMSDVEWHQSARGIEHIGDRGVLTAGIANRVGEQRPSTLFVRPPEHPTGKSRRSTRRICTTMVDHFTPQLRDLALPQPPTISGQVRSLT